MNKKDFAKLISERVLIFDGATGTELQKKGYLEGVKTSEELNIKYPERILDIHKSYLDAGSDIILANTFGANRLKLAEYGLESKMEELNFKGVELAKREAAKYGSFVAGDIASLGSYIAPLGNISFDDAYGAFSEQANILSKAGADLIVIETMAEIREVKAALLAVKDNFDGPVIVQMTFTADGSTVTGTHYLAFLSVVEAMGADGLGMNCSVGPKDLAALAAALAPYTALPISFKPNAGMPKLVNRETVFPGTPEEFLESSLEAYNAGVNILGGCCGTGPAYIKLLASKLKNKNPVRRPVKDKFLLSSRTKALNTAEIAGVCVIGERINPTNRKKFQEELSAGNFSSVRREAQEQFKSGAHILDLNLGLPGADEKALMIKAVEEIQEVVSAPLCLDSSSNEVLEAGLKTCAGKPLINSVNGEDEKLEKVLTLAGRYGAAVVGLTVDEKGIPDSADKRLAIAEKILSKAKSFGLPEREIFIDYLTLSASAMAPQINETLRAIRESKKRWPEVKTVLGVSNVSFGLPNRQALNSTFLKLARAAGLDFAILNPHEDWSIDDNAAKDLLLGKDPDGKNYLNKHSGVVKKTVSRQKGDVAPDVALYNAVVEGSREEIAAFVKGILAAGRAPLEVANDILLKALSDVGEKFNRKEFFLPQIIRSAEAAQAAFALIKPLLKKDASFSGQKIILATVKGDVHDIGKNIVAAVLESHGWEVVDLGKNVESETIVETARKERIKLIGLSALMTTTMVEMEKVVSARNSAKLDAKIIVGGAPVTERYAKEIGADAYAKDAVEAAKIIKLLL